MAEVIMKADILSGRFTLHGFQGYNNITQFQIRGLCQQPVKIRIINGSKRQNIGRLVQVAELAVKIPGFLDWESTRLNSRH